MRSRIIDTMVLEVVMICLWLRSQRLFDTWDHTWTPAATLNQLSQKGSLFTVLPIAPVWQLLLLLRSFRCGLPYRRNQGLSFLWHGDALALENLFRPDFLAVEVLVGVTIDMKRHA